MDDSNRRKHARAAVKKGVLLDENFKLVDLSESGMQLSSAHSRKVGNTLQFTLNLDGRNVYASAVVRWCGKSKSIFSDDYNMGLQFVGMSVNQILILRRYIQHALDNGALVEETLKAGP